MKFKYLIVFLFLTVNVPAQIDSLKILIKSIQRGENDSVRVAANKKFLDGFELLLNEPGSFDMNLDSLKNISIVKSKDGKFRLYTWILPYFDGNKFEYFGFIQMKRSVNPKENKSELEYQSDTIIRLCDSTEVIQKPESEKCSPRRWLGAVYYGLIEESNSGKKFYTLLGWKAKDKMVTQKIIEVLTLEKDQPKFGVSLFKTGSVYKNRMMFSFNSQSSMVLHYDDKFGGIVFDHLSAKKNEPDFVSGPDGTYDGFIWKKGKWMMQKDIDVRTKWVPKEEKELPVSPEIK